jgi:hypothetical protein
MRAVIFRTLAGLLAIAFLGLMVFGDTSHMSLRQVYGTYALAAGFLLYSVLGSDLGERLIVRALGGHYPSVKGKHLEGNETEKKTRTGERPS